MYEFTLVLDREPTDAELDQLVQTDLEAFGIEGLQASVAVEADTLPEALAAAVHAIESTGPSVTGVETMDLVSLKDIAERTGRTYESVRLLAAGKRGPGGFPAPESTGQWALYSWAQVALWLSKHYGSQAPGDYDRDIAAADHLVRARNMLPVEHRADMARLVNA